MERMTKAFIVLLFLLIVPVVSLAAEELYVSSASGSVSIRLQPDENSPEILKIPSCSQVELLETKNTWGKVVFRKKCGWLNLSYTEKDYTEAANSTGNDFYENFKVDSKSGVASLYSKPTKSYVLGSVVKYTVPNETILNVVKTTPNGWGLVSMNGKFAWVEMKNTTKYESFAKEEVNSYGIYYVYVASADGGGIPLRSRKGGGNASVTIPDCIKLTVREKSGKYGYVSYDGFNGWIELKYTETSLSNAQMAAGKPVNKEMRVVVKDGADVFALPTNHDGVGNTAVGKVKNNTTVFVQRLTKDGWSFVNVGGIKGWIAPNMLGEAEKIQIEKIDLIKPYIVFAAANDKGLPIYDDMGENKTVIAYAPIGLEMKVITKKGDYGYVISDYAAGWADLSKTKKTFDKALETLKKMEFNLYRVTKDTEYRKIPTYSEFCGNNILAPAKVDDEMIVYEKVKTGERKWGLVKYGGGFAWINLNHAKEIISFWGWIGVILGIVILIIAIVVIIFYTYNRRKRNEKQLHNGDCRS